MDCQFCLNHGLHIPATAYCRSCGEPVCDACRKDSGGFVYCEVHNPNNTRPIAGAPPVTPPPISTAPPRAATGATSTPSVGLVRTLFRNNRTATIGFSSLLIAFVICGIAINLRPDSWLNQHRSQIFGLIGGIVLLFILCLSWWSPAINWFHGQTPRGRRRMIRAIEIGASVITATLGIIKFHPSFAWILIVLGVIAMIAFIWWGIKRHHMKLVAVIAGIVLVLSGIGWGGWYWYNKPPSIPRPTEPARSGKPSPATPPHTASQDKPPTPSPAPTDESPEAIAAREAAKKAAADAAKTGQQPTPPVTAPSPAPVAPATVSPALTPQQQAELAKAREQLATLATNQPNGGSEPKVSPLEDRSERSLDPNRPCEPSAPDINFEDRVFVTFSVELVDYCATRNIHFPTAWRHWSFMPATDTGGWMIILARGLGPSGKVDLTKPEEVSMWNRHGSKLLREERLRGKGTVVFFKID